MFIETPLRHCITRAAQIPGLLGFRVAVSRGDGWEPVAPGGWSRISVPPEDSWPPAIPPPIFFVNKPPKRPSLAIRRTGNGLLEECFEPPSPEPGHLLYSSLVFNRGGGVADTVRPTTRLFSPVRSAQWVPKEPEKADARSVERNVAIVPEFGTASSGCRPVVVGYASA